MFGRGVIGVHSLAFHNLRAAYGTLALEPRLHL